VVGVIEVIGVVGVFDEVGMVDVVGIAGVFGVLGVGEAFGVVCLWVAGEGGAAERARGPEVRGGSEVGCRGRPSAWKGHGMIWAGREASDGWARGAHVRACSCMFVHGRWRACMYVCMDAWMHVCMDA
jgi:hypothetical protein